MKQNFIKGALLALALGAVGQAEASVYGYASSSTAGVYDITSEGMDLRFEDPGYTSRMFVPMLSGWLRDGKFCGYAPDVYSSRVYDNFYVEFDWETGQLLSSQSITTSQAMQYAAFNAADGTIYGFGVANKAKCFLKAFGSTPETMTVVCEVADADFCTGLAYNATEEIIVGMKADGSLMKINADGTQELIMETGLQAATSTDHALAYDAEKKVYYCNYTRPDYTSVLFTIDATTGAITEHTLFPDKQCKFLFSDNTAVTADAPAAPEVVSFGFVNGSANGTVVLKMPSATITGDAITSDLHWVATLDGNIAAQGDAKAGAEATAEFTNVSTGMHAFAFYAIAGETRGQTTDVNAFIGVDTPAKPSNVVLTDTEVRWDAVTEGAHGGYIDAQQVTYTVFINGEQIGTTAATSMPLPQDGDTSLRRLTATVTATAAGLTSEEGISDAIVVGDALSLPVIMVPTENDFAVCSTLDGNEDGKSWTFDANEGAFNSGYNESVALDDWLVLPPVNLSSRSLYSFAMEARRKRNFFDQEYMEVRIGKSPTAEALAEGEIIAVFNPESTYNDYVAKVTVATSGKYYIALHCVSLPDQSGVYVKNIKLEDQGVTEVSPAAATNLSAQPAANGELEATVSFRFPETTITGDKLDPALELRAVVTGATQGTLTGHPGETAQINVATAQGTNRISVQVFDGESGGETAYVEVYTGVVVPGKIPALTARISEDMLSAALTWQAPAVGMHGGFIRPEELTYTIYVKTTTLLGDVWEKVTDGVKECSYNYTTERLDQDTYEFGVAAANAAGECADMITSLTVLGTPHNLPMHDSFDSAALYAFWPWVIYMPTDEYNTMWGPLPLSVLKFIPDENSNAVCGQGQVEGALGKAGFPVFSTKGCPVVKISTKFWTGDNSSPDIRLTALTHGMEETVEIGRVVSNGTWNTLEFMLPAEFLDKEWVGLFIETSFPGGTSEWVVLDEYTIEMADGVESIEGSAFGISLSDGVLSLNASEGTAYTVADTVGRVIASGTTDASGRADVGLGAGIYVVRLGDVSRKLIVK